MAHCRGCSASGHSEKDSEILMRPFRLLSVQSKIQRCSTYNSTTLRVFRVCESLIVLLFVTSSLLQMQLPSCVLHSWFIQLSFTPNKAFFTRLCEPQAKQSCNCDTGRPLEIQAEEIRQVPKVSLGGPRLPGLPEDIGMFKTQAA